MRKKFLGVLTGASILLVGFSTVPTLGESSTGVKTIEVISNGESLGTFETDENTVDGFLKESDIELTGDEVITYDDVNNLTDESTLYIDEAITVYVNLDNKMYPYDTVKGLHVSDIIKEASMKDGVDYYYVDGDSTEELYDGMQIKLLSRSEETYTTTVEVPFEVVYQDTEELPEGQEQVVTEGVNGVAEETVKVVYYGGEEYLRKTIDQQITTAPVNKVVKRGVAKTVDTPQGSVPYSQMITMNASAYTAGPESTGKNPGDAGYARTATGAVAQRGVVAVDPSVIPLGTELYIEGYGFATAADTGGAIKGNKIDLCFDSLDEALNFGRRNVNVYILK